MDRERVAVLGCPLVHVDDLHADPVLLQEQGGDETDRTGADDEDLRIALMGHGCPPDAAHCGRSDACRCRADRVSSASRDWSEARDRQLATASPATPDEPASGLDG